MPRLRQPPAERPKPQIMSDPEPFEAPDPEQLKKETEEEQPIEVDVTPDPEPTPKEDAAEELRKQIEAMRRGEAEMRRRAEQAERERDEARQRAQVEAEKARKEVAQSQVTTFDTGIAKETEAVESAKRDLVSATASGDNEGLMSAIERMSEAKARLETLKNGKAAVEAQIEEEKAKPKLEPKPQQTQPTVDQAIDNFPVPEIAKQWLREHKNYVTDPELNAEIQYLHHKVVKAGHEAYSKSYFTDLEKRLGISKADQPIEERPAIVSAPVSREVPDNKGDRPTSKITLTPAQRNAARVAGVTEAEYAKQLVRMQKEKSAGNIGG